MRPSAAWACALLCGALLLAAPRASAAAQESTFHRFTHFPNFTTAGWEKGAALARTAPASLHGNCGYLAGWVGATCTLGRASVQKVCCEALCAWNAAGCGCLPAGAASVARLPATNGPRLSDLAPAALATSICGLARSELYGAGSSCAVPAAGSAKCPAAKPAREGGCAATAAALKAKRLAQAAALVESAYLPLRTTPQAVRARLRRLLAGARPALADGSGGLAAGLDQIVSRVVSPRLVRSGRGGSRASAAVRITRSSAAKAGSRQLWFEFRVASVDALGARHTSRAFSGVALFAPCSSKIESLFIDDARPLNLANSLVRLSPFGRQASAIFSAPAGPAPSPTAVGRRRALAAASPPRQLQRPPQPGGHNASEHTPVTISTIESWLLSSLNRLLASSAVQGYQFPIDGCTTNSTLNSLQFCDKTVASGSKPLYELDANYGEVLSDTCNAMCADGFWQEAANFVCGSTCEASVEAACSSCQDGCEATCSTCQAGVTATCDSCNTACCMGCQVCSPAIPGTPEECCCKVCWCIGGCCTEMCTPAIPGTPAECVSAQLCPNGACDSSCDQSSCDPVCDCTSACASTCDTTCPNCNLDCQQNCESSLNAATLTYKYSLYNITGMGGIRAQSVLLVNTTPEVPGVSYPTATFEVTFLIPSLTVTGQFQGSLNPSYGIPPINEVVVNSTSEKVEAKTVVRVDHVCSAAANMRANTGAGHPSYSGQVTTSLGGSLTTSNPNVTVDLGAEMQAQWQNMSASTGQAWATGTGATAAVQKKVNAALNKVLAQAMDSVLWGWLECAYIPRSPPPPRSPAAVPPLSPKPRSPAARSPPPP